MKIRNEREEIDFSVVGYQFPDSEKTKLSDFNYDVNWLRIQVIHTKDRKSETFENSCLLTYELETLADAMADLLSGKRSSYISEFMEPYLRLRSPRQRSGTRFRFSLFPMPIRTAGTRSAPHSFSFRRRLPSRNGNCAVICGHIRKGRDEDLKNFWLQHRRCCRVNFCSRRVMSGLLDICLLLQ